VLFLWGSNVYAATHDHQKSDALKRINGVDKAYQLSALAGFFVVAILAWLV
jgi:hypothetical protein